MSVRHHIAPFAWPVWSLVRTLTSPAPANALRILIFHDIRPDECAGFERLVRFLKDGPGLITPDEAVRRLTGESVRPDLKEPYLLSFDDGFQSQAEISRQVLDLLGVKGLFFVCPGLMNLPENSRRNAIATHIFDGKVGEADLPEGMTLFDWETAYAMQDNGHVIAAHGMTHKRLTTLSGEALRHEILGAGEQIEENLGQWPSWYAYTFGDIDSINREALSLISSRYVLCRSGIRGANTPKTSAHGLLAEEVSPASPLAYQKLSATGALDGRYKQPRARLSQYVSGLSPAAS